MSTTTIAQQRETERFRADVARIVKQIHAAAETLDPAAIIAHARSLRSILWRAERDGIAVAALTPAAAGAAGSDRPERS